MKKKEKEKKEKKNWAHEGPRKKRRIKDSPYPKKWRKVVHEKESIHHPQKDTYPHIHILIKVYDLLLLWIRTLT